MKKARHQPLAAKAVPLLFVSYSRRDFNFAEAATAALNQNGDVKAWMDIEHLRPGMDWGKTIDDSLAAADAFLLIASPAALASPYVTDEWRRAVKRGIPIHIAIVQEVDLPPELATYPVHDLRPRFWPAIRRVGRLIANRQESTAGTLRSGKFGTFAALPLPLLALLGLSAFVVFGILYLASITWELHTVFAGAAEGFISEKATLMIFYTLVLAGSAVTIAVMAGRLLYRRSSLGDLGYAFGMAAVFLFYSLQPISDNIKDAVWFYERPDLDYTQELLGFTSLGVLVAFVAIAILLTRSRTIHLWLPMGETYYSLRQRLLGLAVTRQRKARLFRPGFASQWKGYVARLRPLFLDQKVTFAVYGDAADDQIAGVIRSACKQAGLTEQAPRPAWAFILVSSMTNWTTVREYRQKFGKRAVFVLIDNVQLSNDAAEFRRQQWLDFREQLPEGLFNFLAGLGNPSSVHEAAALPINSDRFRAPQTIRGLIVLCQTYLTMIAALTLGGLLLKPTHINTWLLFAAAVPLVVCFTQLLRRTATRRLAKQQFGILSIVVSLFFGLWLSILIAGIPIAGDEPPVAGIVLAATILLSVSLTLGRIYFQVSRYWLPAKVLLSHRQSAAAMPPFFASYMPLVAVVSFALAILFFVVE